MGFSLIIIEDDDRAREIVNDYFSSKGFNVFEAIDGADALEKLQYNDYDIALLDIMMPHIDGFTVCRNIRSKSNIPVIFLTARIREDDMLFGYELGADDYITKPFSLPVLHAKVMSLINRSKGTTNQCYEFDNLKLNSKNRTVMVNKHAIILAHKEYDLLLYLVENRGIILSRNQIIDAIWGIDFGGDNRVVDTRIKKLRASLGTASKYIKTVIKVGYYFEEAKR